MIRLWWRQRRKLICLLEEGTTDTISGIVRSNEPSLTAPLSGRSCVLYEVRRHLGLRNERRALFSQNFWVEDSSGRALIRMPVGRARMRLENVMPNGREGVICEGDVVVVRGRVSYHVVPDPWLLEAYRIAKAVPVMYGEGNELLAVFRKP